VGEAQIARRSPVVGEVLVIVPALNEEGAVGDVAQRRGQPC
jgi:hypothetical protein